MPHRASCTGLSPSTIRLSRRFHSPSMCNGAVLQPRGGLATVTVWALPRSLATTGGIIRLFSLPRGTKMFQFPRLASGMLRIGGLQPPGLSHSEIRGSMAICAYPRLIAACHVLHRLSEPRHPPSALFCFPSTPHSPKGDGSAHTFSRTCSPRLLAGGIGTLFLLDCKTLQSCLCQYVKCRLPSVRTRPCGAPPALGERVENIGFEPMTSCMPCKRSSQLS